MTDLAVRPPAPVPPTPGDRERRVAPARRLLAGALVAGLTLEAGLRGSLDNLVVAVGVGAVVAVLVLDGHVRQRGAQLAALAALAPVAFLAVRSSPWLAISNLAVASALIVAAVLYSRSGSLWDATPGRVLQRLGPAALAGLAGVTVVGDAAPRVSPHRRSRAARIAPALAITVPVLGLVVVLLASADAVFAGFLTPDIGVGTPLGHLALAVVMALPVLVLAGAAGRTLRDDPPTGGFGVAEVVTMLGLTAAVLGLFVTSQLVALTDAGERLVTSAGLTPAEYARSGFFQLCWATGLLLGFLVVVRALATREALEAGAVRVLGAVVPLLTLGLVIVSLRRMALYDRAFGLTMLRLWVVGAALWMGAVLVMTAVRNARRRGGGWVMAGAGLAAVVLVVGADLADPEAFVVRHNLARADEADIDVAVSILADAEIGPYEEADRITDLDPDLDGGTDGLDLLYLSTLSDDAVPALADAAAATDDPRVRDALVLTLGCGEDDTGVAALNVSAARAAEARRDLCPA